MLRIPDLLLAQRSRSEAFGDWLDALPALARDVLKEWELHRDGDLLHGRCSLVIPVRTSEGAPAMLKLGLPDEESEHEALALRHWGGQGAVLLLRADPRRRALLLERLGSADLTDEWDLEACRVVGGLYAALHRPAPPQLQPLTATVERWRDDLSMLPRDAGLPRRLVEQAVSIAGGLLHDPATTGTLVHTDLHYANVLAADRAPWLAIDPKPVSGDPHCECAPMLWNRWQEVADDAAALRWTMRERLSVLSETGGLDEDRARAWAVLRLVMYARWVSRSGDQQELTAVLRIIKAVSEP